MTEQPAARSSLLRSTSTVSMMTGLSRILGFVRDTIIAQIFGAGPATDAFFVAFKIPNFMRRLFAEGAFSQAFVPVLSEYITTQTHEEERLFISRMSGTLGFVLLLVTVVAIIASPVLIWIFAPGFGHGDSVRFGLANEMLKITFPYLLFISLTAFAGAVQNSHGRFAAPAFAPVLLNVCMILAALYLAPYFHVSIVGLAWGVFFAGVFQCLFQWYFLWPLKLLAWPRLAWKDPGVRRVLKLMVPALFGVSVGQINLLLDTVFASFLVTGSVSWLYYSDRFTGLPLGIFGVAISTVILPYLSRKHASKAMDDYSKTLDWALRSVLLIGVPSAVGFFVLGGPLLVTLLNHGEFSRYDVVMTLRSTLAFAVGIPFFMMIKVLAAGFYSRQNIATPVRIGIIAMISNMVLNATLIWSLKHAGLALATSIAAIINAGLLYLGLIKKGYYQPQAGWLRFGIQLFVANAAMALVVWYFAGPLTTWYAWSAWVRVWHLSAFIVLAVLLYFGALWVVGMRRIARPS